jgi:hypothetical protein
MENLQLPYQTIWRIKSGRGYPEAAIVNTVLIAIHYERLQASALELYR